MTQPTIVLAGAAGDLGGRITRALVERGATVRVLVCENVSTEDSEKLTALAASLAEDAAPARYV